MRRLFAIFLALYFSDAVQATDYYCSMLGGPTGVGPSGTGAVGNPWSLAVVNTTAVYSSPTVAAGKVSPGDTLHFQGIFTAEYFMRTSGLAGSPITLLFDPGAKFAAPTFPAASNGAAFEIFEASYVTLNGDIAGGQQGIIECTANGDLLANSIVCRGVYVYTFSGIQNSNIIIENLTVRNIYTAILGISGLGSVGMIATNFGIEVADTSNAQVLNCTSHDAYYGVYCITQDVGALPSPLTNELIQGCNVYNCAVPFTFGLGANNTEMHGCVLDKSTWSLGGNWCDQAHIVGTFTSGTFNQGDTIYQGTSLGTATATATVGFTPVAYTPSSSPTQTSGPYLFIAEPPPNASSNSSVWTDNTTNAKFTPTSTAGYNTHISGPHMFARSETIDEITGYVTSNCRGDSSQITAANNHTTAIINPEDEVISPVFYNDVFISPNVGMGNGNISIKRLNPPTWTTNGPTPPGTGYVKHNFVKSPANSLFYYANTTVAAGGADPSVNAAWTLWNGGAGVLSTATVQNCTFSGAGPSTGTFGILETATLLDSLVSRNNAFVGFLDAYSLTPSSFGTLTSNNNSYNSLTNFANLVGKGTFPFSSGLSSWQTNGTYASVDTASNIITANYNLLTFVPSISDTAWRLQGTPSTLSAIPLDASGHARPSTPAIGAFEAYTVGQSPFGAASFGARIGAVVSGP
jgi:hypothetical protein